MAAVLNLATVTGLDSSRRAVAGCADFCCCPRDDLEGSHPPSCTRDHEHRACGSVHFSGGIYIDVAGSLEHELWQVGKPHLVQCHQPHESEAGGHEHARQNLDPGKGMVNLDHVPRAHVNHDA